MLFRTAAIFGDHMVLQRDKDIRLFGNGRNGLEITAQLADNTASTVISDDRWQLSLPPMDAGGPYRLTLTGSQQKIVFEDVMIGEVWLAGGQSNMEMMLAECADGEHISQSLDLPDIRYYNVPKLAFIGDAGLAAETESGWKSCSSGSFGDISGAAFFFAQQINQALGVPIGIIGCYWGGTSATCWMSEQCLEKTAEGRHYLREYQKSIDGQTDAQYEQALSAFEALQVAWQNRYNQARTLHPNASIGQINEAAGPYPWPPPMGKRSALRPAGLYHTMLRRVMPYCLRGFIYYQGEEDTKCASMYAVLLKSLIELWRSDFGDQTLPFLFVQLPMFNETGQKDQYQWAVLREQQYLAHKGTPHTGLAVLADCGEADNIHPLNKKTVGQRLALQALSRCYGFDVIADAPVADEVCIRDHQAYVRFTDTGGGLIVRAESIACFEVAGEDGQYKAAEAMLCGQEEICVSHPSVCSPKSIRYAWKNYCEVTLFGRSGLPVMPFFAQIPYKRR